MAVHDDLTWTFSFGNQSITPPTESFLTPSKLTCVQDVLQFIEQFICAWATQTKDTGSYLFTTMGQ